MSLLAAGALLLILPGWGIYRIVAGKETDWALRPPGAIGCSLGVLVPFLVFSPVSHVISTGLALVAVAAAGLAGAVCVARGRSSGDTSAWAILAIVAGAAVALWLGAAQDGDSYLHLSIVQRTLREGVVPRDDAFYAGGANDARYGYTLWHPLLASLSILSGLPAIRIWTFLPALIVPLYLLSVASLCTAATGAGRAGFFASAAALLFHLGIQHGRLLPLAANPSHLACMALVPTVLTLTLLYVRRGGRLVIGVGLTTLAVASVHPFHGVLEVLAVLGLCLPFLVGGDPAERRRAGLCLLVIVVVMAPLALLRLSCRLENPFWLERGDHWTIAPGLWAPSPTLFLPRRPGYLWLVYGLGLIYLVRPSSSKALRGLALAVVLPLAVGLNPLVAPWLAARLSPQMLPRLDHVTFYVLGFVLIGAAAARLWKAVGGCWGGMARALLLGLLLVGFWQSWPAVRDAHRLKQKRERLRGFKTLEGELYALGSHLSPGEVVVSDQTTSFLLPTFLPVRVVAIPRGSASPAEAGQDQRECDALQILDPSTRPEIRAALLRKYNAAAAIVDTTRNPRVARLLAREGSGMDLLASSGRFVLFRPTPPTPPFATERASGEALGLGSLRFHSGQAGRAEEQGSKGTGAGRQMGRVKRDE